MLTTQGVSATLRRAVGTGKAGPIGGDTSKWGPRNWKNHDERREEALGKVAEGAYINPVSNVEGLAGDLHRLVTVNGSYTDEAKEKLRGVLAEKFPKIALPRMEAKLRIEGPQA